MHALPQAWKISRVIMLFKKGDPACCDNYRPISLLAMGYKILAAVLLARLKQAGAEQRIWRTQFGFKSGCGTMDALFLTRRLIDDVWATQDSNILFAALDWSKAFDSISPEGLALALHRFGIPDKFVEMIQSIYSERRFLVSDFGNQSDLHP